MNFVTYSDRCISEIYLCDRFLRGIVFDMAYQAEEWNPSDTRLTLKSLGFRFSMLSKFDTRTHAYQRPAVNRMKKVAKDLSAAIALTDKIPMPRYINAIRSLYAEFDSIMEAIFTSVDPSLVAMRISANLLKHLRA